MKTPRDDRLTDELASFVALLAEEKIARGMPPKQAWREARLETGGIEQVKEEIRDAHPGQFFDRLRQDVVYGLRLLRRAPAASFAVIVALALGIGATAATFNVVDAVLMRPLPYAHADELVVVMHRRTDPVAPANFLDWQRAMTAFSALAAAEYWTPTVGTGAGAEKLSALRLSEGMLPMLGVPPALGTFPRRGDDGVHEVVIADSLWRRQFGAEMSAIGAAITLDGARYTVVGVMPPTFAFAPFWATRSELWAPLSLASRAGSRSGQSLRVFGRLAAGVTVEQARASAAAVTDALEARYPGTNRDVVVTPLKEVVVGDVRHPLVVLFAAVVLVLLVACVNVAHLLLTRAVLREKEVTLRAALGASRSRMVRQFLTEHLLLAAIGGAAGVVVATWMIAVVRQLGATSVPRLQTIGVDARLLAFTAVMSLGTAILFGLLPALKGARPDLTTALRDGDRGTSAGRRTRRLRLTLLGSQVALAVTLLVGAGLLLRSFAVLRAVDPGFDPDHLLSLVVSVAGSAEAAPGRRLHFYDTLLERLRGLPGVVSASGINHVPLAGDLWGMPLEIDGRPAAAPGETLTAAYRVVLPGYFATMRSSLVGRDFSGVDREDAPGVIIVNRYVAETHFPGVNAIGKRVRVAGGEWRTIVGVAGDAIRSDWRDSRGAEIYLPLAQVPPYRADSRSHYASFSYVVRTSGDPRDLITTIRQTVRTLAPAVPVSDVLVMNDVVRDATGETRFVVVLLAVFAAIAWVLAAVGIYGVVSHGVTTRRKEIGIRLALGAPRQAIVAAIVGDTMAVIAGGMAVGAIGAVALGAALSGLLYGVALTDFVAFGGAAAALGAAAVVACLVPIRRAVAVNLQRELD